MGGIKNIIKFIVEYIDVKWVSCLSKRGIKKIGNSTVDQTKIEWASFLSNGGIKYVEDTRTQYRGGYHYTFRGSSESNNQGS
jgi:hypothetical protein